MTAIVYYLLAGVCAGLVSGLFGVGGGIVIVPVLLFMFKAQGMPDAIFAHMAVGTSLAIIVVNAISSVRAHNSRNGVMWPVFWRLVAGIVIGALLGAQIADLLSSEALKTVFAVFLLIVSVQMALNLRPGAHRELPGPLGLGIAGFMIGTVSALIGIGGGSLTVPYLSWCGAEMRKAVGTSAACGLPIALAGVAGFMWTGWGNPDLPAHSTGFVYWPAAAGIAVTGFLMAPVGAKLAHRLPATALKRGFAAFIAIVGVRLLIG